MRAASEKRRELRTTIGEVTKVDSKCRSHYKKKKGKGGIIGKLTPYRLINIKSMALIDIIYEYIISQRLEGNIEILTQGDEYQR